MVFLLLVITYKHDLPLISHHSVTSRSLWLISTCLAPSGVLDCFPCSWMRQNRIHFLSFHQHSIWLNRQSNRIAKMGIIVRSLSEKGSTVLFWVCGMDVPLVCMYITTQVIHEQSRGDIHSALVRLVGWIRVYVYYNCFKLVELSSAQVSAWNNADAAAASRLASGSVLGFDIC